MLRPREKNSKDEAVLTRPGSWDREYREAKPERRCLHDERSPCYVLKTTNSRRYDGFTMRSAHG
jgi:hypothetical protein